MIKILTYLKSMVTSKLFAEGVIYGEYVNSNGGGVIVKGVLC